MSLKNKNKGFTLVELMVVIAIVGIMTSVVLASLATARSKGRDIKRVSEMKNVEKALYYYALNNNGNVPISAYTTWDSVPKKVDGTVDCSDAALIANNANLYDTLVQGKALSSRPATDPWAAYGYCYVYVTDGTVVAGAMYDQQGRAMGIVSGKPIASVISSNVKSAVFGTFLENTKTTDGYKAFVAISYGSTLPMQPNVNLTTGTRYNVLLNEPLGSGSGSGSGAPADIALYNYGSGLCIDGSGSGSGAESGGSWYPYCYIIGVSTGSGSGGSYGSGSLYDFGSGLCIDGSGSGSGQDIDGSFYYYCYLVGYTPGSGSGSDYGSGSGSDGGSGSVPTYGPESLYYYGSGSCIDGMGTGYDYGQDVGGTFYYYCYVLGYTPYYGSGH